MGQVTIYLDQQTEKKLRDAAEQEKLSLSKWIARLICEKTGDTWPASIEDLAGTWPDALPGETLRENIGDDIPREPF